ncbi:hypothetical protein EDB19DRAFT_1923437 [Suillus lakei]|nr:hypothetical protein EDB19DRAFT_1923437 [Suillus lakei]
MPPRRTAKATGKKRATTGDEEGSDLHLDMRPVVAQAPKIDPGKETQKLDSQVSKCKAGVAWIDILATINTLKFGTYNDRSENEAETVKLMGSFKGGIVPMKDSSAIPIIINLKRIKPGLTLAPDFTNPEEVPQLELSDGNEIIVASGQHRLAALKRYHGGLKDELTALTKKCAKIKELKHPSQDRIDSYNAMRLEMSEILGQLEGIGKWGVTVYNEVKLLEKGDTLATHLSRNSTLHEYKETEEEVLMTILKEIKKVYDAAGNDKRMSCALEKLNEMRVLHAKNARLQKVLQQDGVCMLLATRFLRLGPHFRRRHEFKVTWLAKAIDVNMGLYVSLADMRCTLLCKLASKKAFPSYKDVNSLLTKAKAGDAAAAIKVKALRESIADCEPKDEGDLSMWAEVISAIDTHAATTLEAVSGFMEEMSPTYVSPLSTYRDQVIKTLQQKWGLSSRFEAGENEILDHQDSVVARVLLQLTPDDTTAQAPAPLLGGFTLDYIWSCLTRVQLGIGETCRWFEALLDNWHKIHPKSHLMDDWSTVMLSNIKKDPRFASSDDGQASVITNIIWTHRNSFVMRLNNMMVQIDRRQEKRPVDKKGIDNTYANLPDAQLTISEALIELILAKRSKSAHVQSRDLTNEPLSVAGTLALHVTAWDWLNPGLKNKARDIEECVKAITLERLHMMKYRPKMLDDVLVGTLRGLLEAGLSKCVRPKETINNRGQLQTVQEFVFWDSLTLDDKRPPPEDVIAELKNMPANTQQRHGERLSLESIDRDALTKLVNYVGNLACAQASTDPNSLMSVDVAEPLLALVTGLALNSARLRMRALANDQKRHFDVSKDVDDLHIELPPSAKDKFTTYPPEDVDDVPDVPAPAVKGARKGGARTSVPVTDSPGQSPTPDTQPNVQPTSSNPGTPRPIPKPRPIPRKQQHQPSPLPLSEAVPPSGHDDIPSPSQPTSSTVVPVD